jgi:hypothetical protein
LITVTDKLTSPLDGRTVESMSANQLALAIRARADYLREIADRLDRYADDVPDIPANPRRNYGGVVQDAVSALANMWPNLNLSRLVDAATDADIARAKGE